MEPNKLARLETPQTAYLISQFPEVEYLEAGHVAEWLSTRKDQLLILAKEERIGSSLAKTISIATAAIGAVCYATSPLAPLGAVLGVAGYVWAQVTDSSHTHTFNPIPFIRGGVLDVIGSMGHSEARKEFVAAYDEFDQLKDYLAPVERQEYQMLRGHMALITEYLNQIESGKRFYAYRWICDQFILMRGTFPSMQQTREHTDTMQFTSPLVDCDRIKFIQDASQAPQPRPLIQDAPRAKIQDAPRAIIQDAPRARIQDAPRQPENETATTTTATTTTATYHRVADDSKIDIIGEMTNHVQNLFCVGQGGTGKGMLIANAMRELKEKHPGKRIFVMDGKASDRESGYFDGVADIRHKLKCDVAKDSTVAEWFESGIAEYHNYAAENDIAGTLLIIDEATVIGSKLKSAKSTALGDVIIAVASCGDEQGKNLWMFGQTPFAGGGGLDLTGISQLISIVLVRSQGIGVLNQWKRSSLFEKLDIDEVTKLANSSECNRAVYWGGSAKWYSMPTLTNFSSFNRDTRTTIGEDLGDEVEDSITILNEKINDDSEYEVFDCIEDKLFTSEVAISYEAIRNHVKRKLPHCAKKETIEATLFKLKKDKIADTDEDGNWYSLTKN